MKRKANLSRRRRGKSARLSAELDKAWSQVIRSKGICERCGRSDGVLHAHHIVGRRNHRTRWLPQTGCCLCYRDHRWAHEEPLEFADWIRAHRPNDVAYLESVKNEISHYSDPDKRVMLESLQAALAGIDLSEAA